jgi:hypothetical protein
MSKDVVQDYTKNAAELLDLKRKGARNTRKLNQTASALVDKITEYTGLDREIIAEKVKEKQKNKRPA